MKKFYKIIVALSMLVNISYADTIGGEIGYASWGTKLSGTIKKNGDTIDLEKDLGYGHSTTNYFIWGYIDHPLPLLPNLKIQKTSWNDSSRGTVTKSINFANQTFTYNTIVDSKIKLDQIDIIPYWRLLDNWINFDLGINLKVIDGNVYIVDTANPAHYADENFNAVVPMGYAKVRFDMPFTGLSIESDVNYISYNGSSFSDIKAGITYQQNIAPLIDIGATIGYRKENITLDDVDGLYSDIDIKGVYFGAFIHF
jgi:outer membrane protein